MTMPISFQDRSFRLALELLNLYRVLSRETDVPRYFLSQMLSAGTSTGANLEEAKSASSRRDMAAKYAIGLREVRECHYWLRLIKVDQPQFTPQINALLDECWQLIATLSPAIRKLRVAQAIATTSVVVIAAAAVVAGSCLLPR